MTNDMIMFRFTTSEVDVQAELPLDDVVALIVGHLSNPGDVEDIIGMLSTGIISCGSYDGDDGSFWFVRMRPRVH